MRGRELQIQPRERKELLTCPGSEVRAAPYSIYVSHEEEQNMCTFWPIPTV